MLYPFTLVRRIHMELADKIVYKGTEFLFDACADVRLVVEGLQNAGECPGIMNSVFERKIQEDGSVKYTFLNGDDELE